MFSPIRFVVVFQKTRSSEWESATVTFTLLCVVMRAPVFLAQKWIGSNDNWWRRQPTKLNMLKPNQHNLSVRLPEIANMVIRREKINDFCFSCFFFFAWAIYFAFVSLRFDRFANTLWWVSTSQWQCINIRTQYNRTTTICNFFDE